MERMNRGYMEIELPGRQAPHLGRSGGSAPRLGAHPPSLFFKRCMLFRRCRLRRKLCRGEWDTPDIERVIAWFLLNTDNSPAQPGSGAKSALINLLRGWNRLRTCVRPNSLRTSRRNIAEHYDLGNDFYRLWLDPTMTYSSAVFTNPARRSRRADLPSMTPSAGACESVPTDHVLEIGCGWGGFAEHAAAKYGCRVTGVTISQAQYDFARERMRGPDSSDRVEIRLQDYREIEGRFDKIVSIEMMEALGDKYSRPLPQNSRLARSGWPCRPPVHYRAGLPARGTQAWRRLDSAPHLPGSLLLSVGRVNQALNRTGDLFLHALSDTGPSYARTLRLWREAFNRQLGKRPRARL
jgi:cyclopropane-fatty-acyl-phospholipid synthase